MPTRRTLLRAGGAATLAALAGCQSVAAPFGHTSQPESSGAGEYWLDADAVPAHHVQSGDTVGVASPALHELVADAADADGRVDLQTEGRADSDETLALGEFAYVEFDGETYEPTASFAGFAGEASYLYEPVAVDDDEIGEDDEVLAYGNLTDGERAIADELLDSGDYEVGHHEEKPEAVETLEAADYLQADGETYRIRETVGDYAAHHMLALDEADPDEDARVVTVLDERPAADWSDVLTEARTAGSVGVEDVPSNEVLVQYLREADYVATATHLLDVAVTQTVQ